MGIADRVLGRFVGGGTLHVAKEFGSDEELKQYLQDHKKADPKKHWVKGKKPGQKPEQEAGQSQKPQLSFPYTALKSKPPEAEKPKRKRAPRKDPQPKAQGQEQGEAKELKPKEKAKPKAKHPFQQKLKITTREKIGEGLNGAEILTVTDEDGNTHQGVWKTVKGELAYEETNDPLRDAIPAGTFYQREALASDFDDIFGGERVIPHTYVQELPDDEDEGETVAGSLQEFEGGCLSTADMRDALGGYYEMDNHLKTLGKSFQAKKMFFMDLISANDDRHSGNSLWKEDEKYGFVPIAIDNGLTFPDGEGCRFLFALEGNQFVEEVCRPDAKIKKCLKNLDLQKLADRMNEMADLSTTAKLRTLARAQAFKNAPEVAQNVIGEAESLGDSYDEAVFNWVSLDGTARVERGEITEEEYEKIREMVKGK